MTNILPHCDESWPTGRSPDEQEHCGAQLTDEQQAAHDLILQAIQDRAESVALLGCAGVGKTFTLGALVKSLIKQYGEDAVQVATPTHKAARQAERAMRQHGIRGIEASTAARLFNLVKCRDYDSGIEYFAPDPNRPPVIEAAVRVLICEEASMWDQALVDYARQAAETHMGGGVTLLFVGDPRQLPPVKDGKLCDIFPVAEGGKGNCEHVFRLTEVQRHAGVILDLATATREAGIGRVPFADAQGNGSRIITYPSVWAFEAAAIEAAASPQAADDPDDLRILCFTNRNVTRLNAQVRRRCYGDTPSDFVVGERIISHDAIIGPDGSTPIVHSTTEMVVERIELGRTPVYGDKDDIVLDAAFGPDRDPSIEEAGPWLYWELSCRVGGIATLKTFRVLSSLERKRWDAIQKRIAETAKAFPKGNATRQRAWSLFFRRRDEFGKVQPASCLTVHKSQGSTYRRVFLHPDIDYAGSRGPTEAQNRLAYVGITRAGQELHVVGDHAQASPWDDWWGGRL